MQLWQSWHQTRVNHIYFFKTTDLQIIQGFLPTIACKEASSFRYVSGIAASLMWVAKLRKTIYTRLCCFFAPGMPEAWGCHKKTDICDSVHRLLVIQTENNRLNERNDVSHLENNRRFNNTNPEPVNTRLSHDVTAAMLVSLNKGTAAMLVFLTDPPGIPELYYHANVFFCFGENTPYNPTEWYFKVYQVIHLYCVIEWNLKAGQIIAVGWATLRQWQRTEPEKNPGSWTGFEPMTARLGCSCFTDRAVKRWELSSLYPIARASNYVSATGRFCAMFLLKFNFLYSSDEVTVNKIYNLV